MAARSSAQSNTTLPGVCPPVAPHDDIRDCTALPDFHILETLGEGTFGKVVKATLKTSPTESVAIKVMNKDRLVSLGSLNYARQELEVHLSLNHPNIVDVLDVREDEKNLYLILRWVNGCELFDIVQKRGLLPEDEARNIFAQLMSAVDYLHTHGIAHRDIKLENVLVEKETGKVRLIDFGLSRFYRRGDLLSTSCGADVYAAPEMYTGSGYDPMACDVWSCGVVLWALVTGFTPFRRWEPVSHYIQMMRLGTTTGIDAVLSFEVRDMFSRIFTTDFLSRASARQLRTEPWLQSLRLKHVFADPLLPADRAACKHCYAAVGVCNHTSHMVARPMPPSKSTNRKVFEPIAPITPSRYLVSTTPLFAGEAAAMAATAAAAAAAATAQLAKQRLSSLSSSSSDAMAAPMPSTGFAPRLSSHHHSSTSSAQHHHPQQQQPLASTTYMPMPAVATPTSSSLSPTSSSNVSRVVSSSTASSAVNGAIAAAALAACGTDVAMTFSPSAVTTAPGPTAGVSVSSSHSTTGAGHQQQHHQQQRETSMVSSSSSLEHQQQTSTPSTPNPLLQHRHSSSSSAPYQSHQQQVMQGQSPIKLAIPSSSARPTVSTVASSSQPPQLPLHIQQQMFAHANVYTSPGGIPSPLHRPFPTLPTYKDTPSACQSPVLNGMSFAPQSPMSAGVHMPPAASNANLPPVASRFGISPTNKMMSPHSNGGDATMRTASTACSPTNHQQSLGTFGFNNCSGTNHSSQQHHNSHVNAHLQQQLLQEMGCFNPTSPTSMSPSHHQATPSHVASSMLPGMLPPQHILNGSSTLSLQQQVHAHQQRLLQQQQQSQQQQQHRGIFEHLLASNNST